MRPNLSSPDLVAKIAEPMTRYRVEHFRVALLDVKRRLIKWAHISKGSLTMSVVHPREVFRPAIVGSAHSIILVHNHPSGDATPSLDDIKITDQLKRVGDMVGIKVLDHVIVGKEGYHSFREDGLL